MDREVTWASEKCRKHDLKLRKRAEFKRKLFMMWHSFYWKVLHTTKLAGPYSKAMCKLNLYRRFPDGRCMWCGEDHYKKSEVRSEKTISRTRRTED